MSAAATPPTLRLPTPADGAALWKLASDAGELDVNSAYAYVLWCRDFARTSIVAEDERTGELAGFITGYRRPDAPEVLFIWQVAVAPGRRGEGIGRRMLEALVERGRAAGVGVLEATVSPANAASAALFGAVARTFGASVEHPAPGGFGTDVLPEGHDEEPLLRISPL